MEFKEDFVAAVRSMFGSMGANRGITLVASGSFARNNFVEGSDFDFYYVLSERFSQHERLSHIKAYFKRAEVVFDPDVIPVFSRQTDLKPNEDWGASSDMICDSVTMEDIKAFYANDPMQSQQRAKLHATFDASFIAGDRTLFNSLRQYLMEKNEALRIRLIEGVQRDIAEYNHTEMDWNRFDIKHGKGMIFYYHSVIRLLQFMCHEQPEIDGGGIESLFIRLKEQKILDQKDINLLWDTILFYLLLRNAIVQACKSSYKHPTGYEKKFDTDIAYDVCNRLTISHNELIDKMRGYCDRLVSFTAKINEKAQQIIEQAQKADEVAPRKRSKRKF